MAYCIYRKGEPMNTTNNNEKKWIGTSEAAEFLGVKPATIRDWIRKGKDIHRRKIGKAWKFKYSELEEWARSGKAANN
jgi:excisionase family DNA binding protein